MDIRPKNEIYNIFIIKMSYFEKRYLANRCISDLVVNKLINDNSFIKMIEPVYDIKNEALLKIFFCYEDKNVIEKLIIEGLTLNNGFKIKVCVCKEFNQEYIEEKFRNLNLT